MKVVKIKIYLRLQQSTLREWIAIQDGLMNLLSAKDCYDVIQPAASLSNEKNSLFWKKIISPKSSTLSKAGRYDRNLVACVCVCVYIYIYIYISIYLSIYLKNKKRKYIEQHCDLAFQPTYLHSIWLRSHHRAEGRSLPYHDLKFVWYLGPKAKILSVICMNQLVLTLFTALKLIANICNWVLSHISYLYGSKFKQLKLMNRL